MARHRTQDERSKIVAAWRASGLSAWKFCRDHDVSQASLKRWAEHVGDDPVGFVRLKLGTSRTPAGLAVQIGPVRVLVERGFDGALLRELVEVLTGEGP